MTSTTQDAGSPSVELEGLPASVLDENIGPCTDCGLLMMTRPLWLGLTGPQRRALTGAGYVRAGTRQRCQRCYANHRNHLRGHTRTRRAAGRVTGRDRAALTELRRQVGVPAEGPTAQMLTAWQAEEVAEETAAKRLARAEHRAEVLALVVERERRRAAGFRSTATRLRAAREAERARCAALEAELVGWARALLAANDRIAELAGGG